MPEAESILARISVMESEMLHLNSRMNTRDKANDEFMLRTDERLDKLVAQSDEWSGVRKTLTVLVSGLVIIGGFIGWVFHEFFPHGVRP